MSSYSLSEFVAYLRTLMLSLLGLTTVLAGLLLTGKQPQAERINQYLTFVAAICYEHAGHADENSWVEDIQRAALKDVPQAGRKLIAAEVSSPLESFQPIAIRVEHYSWTPAWSGENHSLVLYPGSGGTFGPDVSDRHLPPMAKFEALWDALSEKVVLSVPRFTFPITAKSGESGERTIRLSQDPSLNPHSIKNVCEVIQSGSSTSVFSNKQSRERTNAEPLEFIVSSDPVEVDVQSYLLDQYWPESAKSRPSIGRFRQSFPDLYPYLPEHRHLPFADFMAQVLKNAGETDDEIELLSSIKVPAALTTTIGVLILLGLQYYFALNFSQFVRQRFTLAMSPPWIGVYQDRLSIWTFRIWLFLPTVTIWALALNGRGPFLIAIIQALLSTLIVVWIWRVHHRLVAYKGDAQAMQQTQAKSDMP
jgi:hypothetical protein